MRVELHRLHPRHASMQGEIRSTHKIRLGFRQIQGIAENGHGRRSSPSAAKAMTSIRDLWLRTGLAPSVLAALAEADAFRSLGLDRRDALWAVRGLNRAGDKDDLPLLKDLSFRALEPEAHLPPMSLGEHVVEDYRHLSLSLKAHPVHFLRERLATKKICARKNLRMCPRAGACSTAGLVLVRQRPGSASGVIFLTMEDETGIANAIVWPKVFETLPADRDRRALHRHHRPRAIRIRRHPCRRRPRRGFDATSRPIVVAKQRDRKSRARR